MFNAKRPTYRENIHMINITGPPNYTMIIRSVKTQLWYSRLILHRANYTMIIDSVKKQLWYSTFICTGPKTKLWYSRLILYCIHIHLSGQKYCNFIDLQYTVYKKYCLFVFNEGWCAMGCGKLFKTLLCQN